MKFFFESLDKLSRYASEVKAVTSCPHCSKKCFLISHGFVYRKTTSGPKCIVGKRVFCSNRCNSSGCGRTFQLYLSFHPPKIHYHAEHLNVFISSLVSGKSIQAAYLSATARNDSRNAYRWLKKLYNNLMHLRDFVYKSGLDIIAWSNKYQVNGFRCVLISTFAQLVLTLNHHYCQRFQEMAQKPIL